MPPAQFCAVMETEPRVCAVHSQGLASELHPQPNMGHSRNSQNGLASGSFHCNNKRWLIKKKGFGVCELAQWVKVLAAQAWSPEHNPQTPWKGERK